MDQRYTIISLLIAVGDMCMEEVEEQSYHAEDGPKPEEWLRDASDSPTMLLEEVKELPSPPALHFRTNSSESVHQPTLVYTAFDALEDILPTILFELFHHSPYEY